jgi:hypothetical protein
VKRPVNPQPRAVRRMRSEVVSALSSGLLEVGDEVVTVLLLLQAGERHLGTGNVLRKDE